MKKFRLVFAMVCGIIVWAVGSGADRVGTSDLQPQGVAPEEAAARAVNRLVATAAGYSLRHPRHSGEFGPEGIRVAPRRGGVEWSWRLTGVQAGERQVSGVSLEAVHPVESAPGVIEYRRGGLLERYVVEAGSLEQQFVIPEPLALEGRDLEIVGEVASTGRFEEAAEGWRWRGERGAIRLGEVRVYDARGNELPARFAVGPGETRLVIAATALATAAYPVTIDPEIGVDDFRISNMGPLGPAFTPAIAYNFVDDEYLVVWQGDFTSAWEFEIYGQRIDAATGEEIGQNDFRISDMGNDGQSQLHALDPDVAYNSTNNEYLVVWTGDDVRDSELEIYGQRLNAAGEEIGNNDFRISEMGPDGDGSFDTFSPAVAYNPAQNEYLVVWSSSDTVAFELEIYGQRLEGATGAEVGEDDFRISDMGPDGDSTFDAERPAVVYNPTWKEYLVAWAGADLDPDEFEIYGQRLDAVTGAEIGENDFAISDVHVDSPFIHDVGNPAVAYNPTQDEYLVVWHADDQPDPNSEIYGQRLEAATGAEIGEDDFRISDMGPEGDDNTNLGAFLPDVAFNPAASEYLVAWYGKDEPSDFGSGEAEIWGQRLDGATGKEVGANDFRLSSMGPDGDTGFDGFSPALAYSAGNNEFLAVWWGDDQLNEDFEIYGQRYAAGLFEDDFEDEAIGRDWALQRGTWVEDQGALDGVPEVGSGPPTARATAVGFSGCGVCTVEAELLVRNGSGSPAQVLGQLMGWFEDSRTNVSVTLKPEQDRLVFEEKEDGLTLFRRGVPVPLEQDILYALAVGFDGSRFQVFLDGFLVLDTPNAFAEAPFGTVALGSRSTEISVEAISVLP